MIPQKQLTLADIFENCKEIYDYDKAILSSNQDIIAKERAAKETAKENHSIAEESGAFVRGASYYGGGESNDQ